jgi:hypothetical protein
MEPRVFIVMSKSAAAIDMLALTKNAVAGPN